MVYFYYGGAGTGKSYALKQVIKEESEIKESLLAIIPEQYSFVYENELYNMLGAKAFSKISCDSFRSMTRNIQKKYGTESFGFDYASDISKYIILYKSIRNVSDRLVFYKKRTGQSSFLSDIFNLINIFRKSSITPEMLYSKMPDSDTDFGSKYYDICCIYAEYIKEMDRLRKKDLTTDLTEIARIADKNGYFHNKIIVMDEFESFSEDQYSVIDKMISSCKDFYISLRTENPFAKNDTIFLSGNITFNKIKDIAKKYNKEISIKEFTDGVRFRKNSSLLNLSKYCFRSGRPEKNFSENISIFEAENIYSETDYIAATIKHLKSEKNYKYSDIAVLTNSLQTYGMHLENAFKRYNIPFNISIRKSTSYMPFMQYISALFEIISMKEPSTEAVLRYIKTDLCNIDKSIYDNIPILEKYVYVWNIKGKKWFEPFYVDSDDDKIAEDIRKAVVEPLQVLISECRRAKTVKEISECIMIFIESQNIDIKLENKDFGDEKINASMELVWNKFIDIIDSFVETAADDEIDLKEYCRLVMLNAERIEFDMPPMMLDSVEIADATVSRMSHPKFVFISGVNEDIFPLLEDEKYIFTDDEKKSLTELDIDIFRSQEQLGADSRLVAYKAISCASEGICLTYSLSGADGQKMYPSDVISRIENIFSETPDIKKKYSDIPVLYYALTYESIYYHYVLCGNKSSSDKILLEKLLKKSKEYSEKIDYLENISAIPEFKIKNTNILRKVIGKKMIVSPTSVEDYKKCPFTYFCKGILNLYKPIPKEINSIERGNVIHYILEKSLTEISKEDFIQMSDKEIDVTAENYGNEYFKTSLRGGISIDNRMKTTFSKIIDDSKMVLRHMRNEFKVMKFVPSQFEFPIGGGDSKLEFELSNGCKMSVKGKIDRIDTAFLPDGRKALRIIDYKTGKHIFSRQRIYDGFDCQMFLYLFSVTDENNIYSDYIPAGVLYMPSGKVPLRTESSYEIKGTIEEYIDKSYGMSGIILNDPVIINSMEEESKAVFIPVSIDGKIRKGDSDSLVLTEKQMNILRDYINKIMISVGDNIYDGEFDCMPYLSTERFACENCDYADICRVSHYSEDIARKEIKIKKKDFMELISESLDEEKKTDEMD